MYDICFLQNSNRGERIIADFWFFKFKIAYDKF